MYPDYYLNAETCVTAKLIKCKEVKCSIATVESCSALLRHLMLTLWFASHDASRFSEAPATIYLKECQQCHTRVESVAYALVTVTY